MKGAFDPDCSGLLQDCRATAEVLYWRLWQLNNAEGEKTHNSLQSLRDTLELPLSEGRGKKKSLPQSRAERQWAVGLFSRPFYKPALTLSN